MPINCEITAKKLGLGTLFRLRKLMKDCLTDTEERCGVIFQNGEWLELENKSFDRKTTWVIEANDIIDRYHEIKAVWHTHPGEEGKAEPSRFDLECMGVNMNLTHIVVSNSEFKISTPLLHIPKISETPSVETDYHKDPNDPTLPKLRTVKFKGFFKSIFGDYLRIRFDTIKDLCEILSLPMEWRPRLKHYWPAMFPGNPWISENLENKLIITMMPPLFGANGAGMFNTIVGALLIVIGVIIGVFFGWTGVGAQVAASLIMAGITTMAAGIYQLLTPTPQQTEFDSQVDGYTGYPKATTKEGTIIPVVYGNVITAGHVLSFISTTGNLAVATPKYAYKPL